MIFHFKSNPFEPRAKTALYARLNQRDKNYAWVREGFLKTGNVKELENTHQARTLLLILIVKLMFGRDVFGSKEKPNIQHKTTNN